MAKQMKPGSQGLQSSKLVHPGVRTGTGSKGVQPGYTAQLGNMKGSHVTGHDLDRSKVLIGKDAIGKPAGNTVKFGNELATNSGSAPGQGRTIHRTGTQGFHGAANPGNPRPAPQRDILRQFGPDVSGRGSKQRSDVDD
jgi:hypothetical protein